jgi:dimethylamine/trimethylamine dehydrogenase
MKAEGGWGVVFTEFCSIDPESDEYPFTSARIWDQGDVVNLGYMCDVAHRGRVTPSVGASVPARTCP